jgi:hypothetical protein
MLEEYVYAAAQHGTAGKYYAALRAGIRNYEAGEEGKGRVLGMRAIAGMEYQKVIGLVASPQPKQKAPFPIHARIDALNGPLAGENGKMEIEVKSGGWDLPDGAHNARYVESVEHEITAKKDGKLVPGFKHFFDCEGQRVDGFTTRIPTLKNRFGELVKAFLGRDIQPGDRIDPAKFQNSIVQIVVKKQDGYCRIIGYFPLKAEKTQEKKGKL